MGFLMPRDIYWKEYVDLWLSGVKQRPDFGLQWFIDIGKKLYVETHWHC